MINPDHSLVINGVNPFLPPFGSAGSDTNLVILSSPFLDEFTEKPNRPLRSKPWHVRRSYARRIRKKWNKRFGVRRELIVIRTPDGNWLTHPNNIPRLEEACQRSTP